MKEKQISRLGLLTGVIGMVVHLFIIILRLDYFGINFFFGIMGAFLIGYFGRKKD